MTKQKNQICLQKNQESNSEVISVDESEKSVPVLSLNIAYYNGYSSDNSSVWETEQQQRWKYPCWGKSGYKCFPVLLF